MAPLHFQKVYHTLGTQGHLGWCYLAEISDAAKHDTIHKKPPQLRTVRPKRQSGWLSVGAGGNRAPRNHPISQEKWNCKIERLLVETIVVEQFRCLSTKQIMSLF